MSGRYIVYTDGSCWPNPDGVGGWAYKVINDGNVYTGSGGENMTTNNRMELTAFIEALITIPIDSVVDIYSDSQYCVNSFNLWLHGWEKRNWVGVKNADMMKELLDLKKCRKCNAYWVRGHNGDINNEEVDRLAEAARISFEEMEIDRIIKDEYCL